MGLFSHHSLQRKGSWRVKIIIVIYSSYFIEMRGSGKACSLSQHFLSFFESLFRSSYITPCIINQIQTLS